MNQSVYISLITIILGACTSQSDSIRVTNNNFKKNQIEEHSLRSDLLKYKGYYSEIESTDGILHQESLPSYITGYKNNKISNILMAHLNKNESGYNLLFNIDFSGNNFLVVSTIDSTYKMIDYKFYPNSTGSYISEKDTIVTTTFLDEKIIIELMHPNEEEEPSFEINGIHREVLIIGKDLQINNANNG